jgi:predicted HTH transcriptional regulator
VSPPREMVCAAMQWDTELHKRNPELLRACVKTVCAFLNGEGGILLIGVANSGEPTGLEDDIRDFKDRKILMASSRGSATLSSLASTPRAATS